MIYHFGSWSRLNLFQSLAHALQRLLREPSASILQATFSPLSRCPRTHISLLALIVAGELCALKSFSACVTAFKCLGLQHSLFPQTWSMVRPFGMAPMHRSYTTRCTDRSLPSAYANPYPHFDLQFLQRTQESVAGIVATSFSMSVGMGCIVYVSPSSQGLY